MPRPVGHCEDAQTRLHRQRKRTRRFDHGEPISRIDTRPMVFVFSWIPLLLLFTVPITPHAVVIDLWDGVTSHPLVHDREPMPSEPDLPLSRITLTDDDQLLWNHEPISPGQLVTLVSEFPAFEAQHIIEFEPEPNASYDGSVKVLHILARSGATFRIAGTEKYCQFDYRNRRAEGQGNSLVLALSIFVPEGDLEPLHPTPDYDACEQRFVVHSPG